MDVPLVMIGNSIAPDASAMATAARGVVERDFAERAKQEVSHAASMEGCTAIGKTVRPRKQAAIRGRSRNQAARLPS
jgi:hypothetical protein